MLNTEIKTMVNQIKWFNQYLMFYTWKYILWYFIELKNKNQEC